MPDEEDTKIKQENDFKKLLDENIKKPPQAGDVVKGTVLTASKSEVRIDIDGILTGVVRGRELYQEADEYADLQPGDEAEATVIEEENENGELELSFRYAGQDKAWTGLIDAFKNKKIITVKVTEANKGGLIVHYRQIFGFLPVSQLAPENYPRVNGGDKSKILDKLRSFINKGLEVKVIAIEEREEKIIFSEKEAWNELQRDIISKYNIRTIVEGSVTAVTDFGVFISFGENLEGLIHISELAWQRIDNPADIFKVGDKIKAEIISVEGSKIFLSAKKLIKDPWEDVGKRYKMNQIVTGTILKINPFGLFVRLDKEIHGLAHVSQTGLALGQKINSVFKIGQQCEFEIVSLEPKDHRLGLKAVKTAEKKDKEPPQPPPKTQDKQTQDKKAPQQAQDKKDKQGATAKKKTEKNKDNGSAKEKPEKKAVKKVDKKDKK